MRTWAKTPELKVTLIYLHTNDNQEVSANRKINSFPANEKHNEEVEPSSKPGSHKQSQLKLRKSPKLA